MFGITFTPFRAVFAVLAAFALAGAAFIFSGSFRRAESPTLEERAGLPPLATATPSFDAAQGKPSAPSQVEGPPPYQGAAIHLLNPDENFLKQVPEETYRKSLEELAALAVRLADNPADIDGWMRVAYIKHFYGDEFGTRDVYEYLNLAADNAPIPFYNLALLYGYYLKEPAKAMPKFEAAIKRDPANAEFYAGFADFYRDVMQDPPAAERVLLSALARLPNELNIEIALASLYRIMEELEKSIAYYERALFHPSLGGQERAAITDELARLRQKLGK